MSNYDCVTFHTSACDDHHDRVLNVHGPEGLDDVCPLCEIERLTAELKQANAVLHDIISGKADGCPDCARHEMVALSALEVTDDE